MGKTLLVDGRPMRVNAVLRDLPSNSDIPGEIFASSRSARSTMSEFQAINSSMNNTLATYFRLRPGVSLAVIAARLPAFTKAKLPIPATAGPVERSLQPLSIGEMHLHPQIAGSFNAKPTVDPAVVLAIGAGGNPHRGRGRHQLRDPDDRCAPHAARWKSACARPPAPAAAT